MGIKYFNIDQPTPQSFNIREKTLPYAPAEEMICSEVSNTLGHLVDECHGRDWNSVTHSVLNFFFGGGSTDIPAKYLDKDGEPLQITRGRCSNNIIERNGVVRHNYLLTYIMPDGMIHAILADVTFK